MLESLTLYFLSIFSKPQWSCLFSPLPPTVYPFSNKVRLLLFPTVAIKTKNLKVLVLISSTVMTVAGVGLIGWVALVSVPMWHCFRVRQELSCGQCQNPTTSDPGTAPVRPAPVTLRPCVPHLIHNAGLHSDMLCISPGSHWPKQYSWDWAWSQLLSSF